MFLFDSAPTQDFNTGKQYYLRFVKTAPESTNSTISELDIATEVNPMYLLEEIFVNGLWSFNNLSPTSTRLNQDIVGVAICQQDVSNNSANDKPICYSELTQGVIRAGQYSFSINFPNGVLKFIEYEEGGGGA
jgi:hypothetical protein